MRVIASLFLLPLFYWTWINLGEIPHCADTIVEYIPAAEGNWAGLWPYHGIGAPLFFRYTGQPKSHPREWECDPTSGCIMPKSWMKIQLAQFILLAIAVLYTIRVVAPQVRGWTLTIIVGLVVFDPLVAHHSLALMSDGLAASCTLLFVAALVKA